MRHNREDIDRFFDYDLMMSTRTIYVGSELYLTDDNESGVDFLMAKNVVKGIYALDQAKEAEITLILNTQGGDVYHGLAVYDAIKAAQSPTKIIVVGSAMSMGAVILQAADVRIMSPNAKLMIHYGVESYTNYAPDTLDAWIKDSKQINRWMEQMFLEKINQKQPEFNLRQLQRLLKVDTIFGAEEALNLGLCDKIGGWNE